MTNNSRMTALRRVMRDTGKDLVALGPGSHMQWLVGFHPHADERPCLLLVGEWIATCRCRPAPFNISVRW